MDFISLSAALAAIANGIHVPPAIAEHPGDNEAWRYSEAAGRLHEILDDENEQRPRWAEVHGITGKPLFNKAVASEGIELLLHVAGWYDYETKNRYDHTMSCIKAGLDPSIVGPAPVDPRRCRWRDGAHLFREHQIGFDRIELSRFLGLSLEVVDDEVSSPGFEDELKEARRIIGLNSARIDHIAWALVILAEPRPERGEARYRQIQGVHDWLFSLGLQFLASNGLPTSPPRGVPVSHVDVREFQYLAISDVRAAAVAAGIWPNIVDAPPAGEGAPRAAGNHTRLVEDVPGRVAMETSAKDCAVPVKMQHGIKTRRNILDGAIDKAIEKAGSDSTDAVFLALRDMALEEVSPFTGDIEGNELFFTTYDNKLGALTKSKLDSRLRRRRKASQAGGSRR